MKSARIPVGLPTVRVLVGRGGWAVRLGGGKSTKTVRTFPGKPKPEAVKFARRLAIERERALVVHRMDGTVQYVRYAAQTKVYVESRR